MKTNQAQFKQALRHTFKQGMLSEGLLDNVMGFLQSLESTWISASEQSEDEKLSKIPNDLEPTENAEDQLHAVVCVCQSVGYALREVLENIDYFHERLEGIDLALEDPSTLVPEVQGLLEIVIRISGNASGWLRNDQLEQCSKKIYRIGSNIDSGLNAAESLENLITALIDIEGLNVLSEIEDVLDSAASKILLEEDPYWRSRGKDFIEQGIEALSRLPEAIDKLESTIEPVLALEALLEETAKAPEVASTEEVVQSAVFESVIFENIYKKVCREILRGS